MLTREKGPRPRPLSNTAEKRAWRRFQLGHGPGLRYYSPRLGRWISRDKLPQIIAQEDPSAIAGTVDQSKTCRDQSSLVRLQDAWRMLRSVSAKQRALAAESMERTLSAIGDACPLLLDFVRRYGLFCSNSISPFLSAWTDRAPARPERDGGQLLVFVANSTTNHVDALGLQGCTIQPTDCLAGPANKPCMVGTPCIFISGAGHGGPTLGTCQQWESKWAMMCGCKL